ncbi:pickpocket protein 28-like [Helicoverpa zea]|uniref:pickpocket protein 28-like n=1 Tax=Helicoverpa zea TaxID=7113 RepID=UPI001F56AA6B|nr:pickpocket protein 28-like [Helicoverpa zea]
MDTDKGTVTQTSPSKDEERKLRRKRQRRQFGNVCVEYTQSTSLQGLPFLTKEGLTMTERIFWLLTIIASLIMCGYLIEDVWTKWQTSPVIVTVSEQLVPVIKVPLPSITICPQAKCKLSVYNYSRVVDDYVHGRYSKTPLEERYKWSGITLLCPKNMRTGPRTSRRQNSTTMKQINEVALDYRDVFKLCNINDEYADCRELFSKVLTASGVCFTMNVLAAEEILHLEKLQQDFSYLSSTRPSQNWSIERGYLSGFDSQEVYPIRGLASDTRATVTIKFQQRLDDHDGLCHGPSPGFQVHVQHPAEWPQTSLYTQTLNVNEQAVLALSFSIMNTSEALRSYRPELRQCYFPGERQLKYFKIYTAKNCRVECLANITLELCECVPFYLPHNDSDQICGVTYKLCTEAAEETMAQREANVDAPDRCKCLESCNAITYDSQLLRTGRYQDIWNPSLQGNNFYETLPQNLSGVHYSELKVFYKSPQFISMRRSELFGVTDFLANCGGLLGLFLGFSFLSLVEIIYFFTLRLCCALRKDRKQQKKNSLEKNEGHELTEECLPSVCKKTPNYRID